MSKYLGPRLRIIRRFGKLKSITQKIPKSNGRQRIQINRKKKWTQFAYRLIEKQKLRFYYGVSEKQLIRQVKLARQLKGSTGKVLLQQLDIRLDNIVYRVGWRPTRFAARQLVSHGHILVNQTRVKASSRCCIPSDTITLGRPPIIINLVRNNLQLCSNSMPSHLSLAQESLAINVNKIVDPREVILDLNELLIIEYYSNRI
jgi:small subunit ribosomal protein S4